jgi:hypothetical protein
VTASENEVCPPRSQVSRESSRVVQNALKEGRGNAFWLSGKPSEVRAGPWSAAGVTSGFNFLCCLPALPPLSSQQSAQHSTARHDVVFPGQHHPERSAAAAAATEPFCSFGRLVSGVHQFEKSGLAVRGSCIFSPDAKWRRGWPQLELDMHF